MRRDVAAIIAALSVIAVACGGSSTPSSPSSTPAPAPVVPAPPVTVANIAGGWNGSLHITIVGTGDYTVTSQATFNQADRDVTGTWFVSTDGWDWKGDFAGTLAGVGVNTTFSGTVTLDGTSDRAGARCHGSGAVSGTVTVPTMAWTASSVPLTDCADTVQLSWAFTQRQ